MKTKIGKLIKSYELEIDRIKSKLDKLSSTDSGITVYNDKICTLKEVIFDLKRIIESKG